VLRWAGAFLATFVAGWLFGLVGVPSSYLFGALVVGLLIALRRPGRMEAPPRMFRASQAFTGVALGAYLESDALEAAAHAWVAVVLVSVATLFLSLLCGIALARWTSLDRPTAALGTVAGGASGIVGMAGELHADDRLVAFMQYLRVLLVVVATPILMALVFPGHHAGTPDVGAGILGDARGWILSLALARYVESQLYGVRARDFATLGAAAALLVMVALISGWLPARKASRVDPMLALRQD